MTLSLYYSKCKGRKSTQECLAYVIWKLPKIRGIILGMVIVRTIVLEYIGIYTIGFPYCGKLPFRGSQRFCLPKAGCFPGSIHPYRIAPGYIRIVEK